MELSDVHTLVESVASTPTDRDGVRRVIAECQRLAGWVEARRLAAVTILAGFPEVLPQHEVATASRSSWAEGDRVVQRAETVELMPDLGEVLQEGSISTRHLDAASAVLHRLQPEQRHDLAERGSEWGRAATNMSVGEFRRFAEAEVRRVQRDDGVQPFERQRRDSRLATWTNPVSGMVCGEFALDPESGARLLGRLRNAVEGLFHDRQPDSCPIHPLDRQHHLQALALMAIVDGDAPGAGRPEVSVVVDLQTMQQGLHDRGLLEVSDGVVLPIATVRRLACDADIVPVVLGSAGEVLDVGRRSRLATPQQRRALRVMYRTCWIPGCDVPFDRCTMHHLHPWEQGGPSDLVNFRPTCNRHHHALHEGGWKVETDGWWAAIVLPDGTRLDTGPPRARAG